MNTEDLSSINNLRKSNKESKISSDENNLIKNPIPYANRKSTNLSNNLIKNNNLLLNRNVNTHHIVKKENDSKSKKMNIYSGDMFKQYGFSKIYFLKIEKKFFKILTKFFNLI